MSRRGALRAVQSAFRLFDSSSSLVIADLDEEDMGMDVDNSLYTSSILAAGARNKKYVDLFWIEKLDLFLDFLQLYGIVWQISQPYPWPWLWTVWTRWIVLFNIDVFSFLPDGALAGRSSNLSVPNWGKMNNYLGYAFGYCFFQFILTMTLLLLIRYQHKLFHTSNKWTRCIERYAISNKYRFHIIAALLYVCKILYIPSTLAAIRVYYCDPSTNYLSVDPVISCNSSVYITYTFFITVMQVITVMSVPMLCYAYVYDGVIYTHKEDHEKRIQAWELCYIYGINRDWIKLNVWLFSSFTLHGAYFHFHLFIVKLLLLIIFIGCRFDMLIQAVLMWILAIALFIYYGFIYVPYRCSSSNTECFILLTLLLINTTFSVMNCFHVENAIMISSVETLILLSFNGLGLIGLIIITVITIINKKSGPYGHWPVSRTINSVLNTPVLHDKYIYWVETILKCNEKINNFMHTPKDILEIVYLDSSLQLLHDAWVDAKKQGSIFELILREVIEELVILYDMRLPVEQQRLNKNLDPVSLAKLSEIMAQRNERYALMNPKKRLLLDKLTYIEAFTSGTLDSRMSSILALIETYNSAPKSEGIGSIKSKIVDEICVLEKNTISVLRVAPSDERVSGQLRSKINELYYYWDTLILMYEHGEFTGYSVNNSVEYEHWYTYRSELKKHMVSLGGV